MYIVCLSVCVFVPKDHAETKWLSFFIDAFLMSLKRCSLMASKPINIRLESVLGNTEKSLFHEYWNKNHKINASFVERAFDAINNYYILRRRRTQKVQAFNLLMLWIRFSFTNAMLFTSLSLARWFWAKIIF